MNPEVRQCQDPDDPEFGAVAVRIETDDPAGLWGRFHPRWAGGFKTDEDVRTWAIATDWAAPAEPPAEPPIDPPSESEETN